MSKARVPKRKEASCMPPSKIEEIRNDILDKGAWLKTMSEKKFPDAEMVLDAMFQLLDVVEEHKLVGKWVSSSATSKEIRDVSSFVYSFCLIRHINV
jgi:hypothetical protein